ncbi:MAG: tautomerase family protein [Planctomycetota bacterium]|jgi:4-oxalocrotonate tautomerase
MPYVHVQITREGDTSPERKAEVIQGMTEVLERVLGKNPTSTFVVIEEVPLESWGIGGLPVEEYRRRRTSEA